MKRMLFATFIFSLTIGFSFETRAQNLPDFEAELKAMEKNQLKSEELQMRNADAVTDVITDEVGNGQAAIERKSATDTDTDETIMMTKKEKEARVRRIRSRPL
ncbi:MAG: hypothetical protein H7336_03080 [Bacteriovorax sp.]|nr:hypothetical protein [Bacteriovorax sp.]